MSKPILVAAAALLLSMTPASAQTAIKIFVTDSLQPAMAELASEFQKTTGGKFKLEPVLGKGAALRERIDKGEVAHVFATGDIGEAKALADAGRTRGPVFPFAKPKAGGGPLGFVILKDAPPAAGELAGFLRFGPGRAILEKHGFSAP